jgi:valyl-tRNA synthetase
MSKLDSKYNPKDYESKWYDFWSDKDYFSADRKSGKEPYTIMMPPPNVTSSLHMGHGTGYTMQDILIRWKRMCGYDACWMPGTDHAGIATQMMVEKSLEKEGLSRKEIGREEFQKRLWDWKEKYGGMILDQFRTMGFSCDWKRLSFTMDPKLSLAVRKIFVDLYNEGLIYRGERLVNWDPTLKTAISDDEVETKEMSGHLWYFRYPIDGSDEFVEIATTRPETMLGDAAVAVNPEDKRYSHLVGKNVKLPFSERLVPIIADDYVKSEFGTGCVKITPAHDPNDFEIGKRHNLPMVNIMEEDGTLNKEVPKAFQGLDRFVARKAVLKGLKELDLFEKEESHKHGVPHSERSKDIIEPRLSKQWYVKMEDMAKPAVEAVKSGDLKFHPDLWKKTYLNWQENIQDWCISRQLWWGHRIPIWYCEDCGATSTGMDDPTECSSCNSSKITQDDDVLDTWFSSWLWPVSTFGWPDDSEDLEHFYPTNVLVTAPEIINLWVARMVMVGLKTRGEIPFKDVFLTATVCDKKGRKFSKTLGNGIDPISVIDKYGTDAVRFTAVHLAPLGARIKMAEEDFEMGARFVNKLWNASRFLFQFIDENEKIAPLETEKMDLPSKWILEEFAKTTETVNHGLNNYRMNDSIQELYRFIWGSFCDWSVETAKSKLNSDDENIKAQTLSVMVYVLEGALRLASPIMPFVTEEIWSAMPVHPDWERPESLVIASFPQQKDLKRFPADHENWQRVQDLISSIRSARSQAEIAPKEKLSAIVKTPSDLTLVFNSAAGDISRLAGLSSLSIGENEANPGRSLVAVGKGFEAFIPAGDLIDVGKELKRLEIESKRLSKIIKGLEGKLKNRSFVDRAPPEVIVQTKEQLENLQDQVGSISKNLDSLR